MIYVLETNNCEYVKIGYTGQSDIEKRINQLQTGNPIRIYLLYQIEGTLKQEQTLHYKLQSMYAQKGGVNIPNEWYYAQRYTFFRNFLKELKYGFSQGMQSLHESSFEARRSVKHERDYLKCRSWFDDVDFEKVDYAGRLFNEGKSYPEVKQSLKLKYGFIDKSVCRGICYRAEILHG